MIDDLIQPRIAEDRSALRRAWRADDRQMIVWVAADYPQAADAATALVAVGLAAETGRACRMLVHSEARGVDRARRVLTAMGCADRLIVEDRTAEAWRIVRAVDVALAMGEHCQRAIRWAMAAGLPIVADEATASSTLCPAGQSVAPKLEHERNALIGRTGRPRTLGTLLIRLADDPALARRLGEAAKAMAQKPSA